MGCEKVSDCCICETCRDCGRGRERLAWFCDECGDYTDDLYEGEHGDDLCETCYMRQFPEVEGGECEVCGTTHRDLFNVFGEILCERCALENACRVDTAD